MAYSLRNAYVRRCNIREYTFGNSDVGYIYPPLYSACIHWGMLINLVTCYVIL